MRSLNIAEPSAVLRNVCYRPATTPAKKRQVLMTLSIFFTILRHVASLVAFAREAMSHS